MPIYEAECSECGCAFDWYESLPTDIDRPCPECGGRADRLFSLSNLSFFQEFTTRNIDPQGKPIHVKSQKQLSSLCNKHNLVHLDDPKAMDARPQKIRTPGQILGMQERPERDMPSGPARKQDIEAR